MTVVLSSHDLSFLTQLSSDINIEMRGTPRSIGADEFLPLFIYVVALSGMDKADEDIR